MQEEQEEPKADEAENWENDQIRRSYYYDDAFGYEIYQPEEDDEKDDED
jgi:hypothetical protein